MESRAGTRSSEPVVSDAGRQPIDRADLAITIVGLLLLAAAVGWLAWTGIFVAAVTGRCGGGVAVCVDGVIAAGVGIAMVGPLLVGVAAVIVSIARLAARRPAWWIPPLAFLVAIAIVFGGAGIAHLGVQQGPRPAWSPEDPDACRPTPDDPYRCSSGR